MKNDSVSLTIDGKTVQIPAGTTASCWRPRSNGIDIPTLCYHPELKPEGHCRLCVVEIGAAPRTRLVNSCTYPVEDGLSGPDPVRESPGLPAHGAGTAPGPGPGRRAHQGNGRGPWAFTRPALRPGTPQARCILCGQCVRTCREVVGVSAISMAFRTPKKLVATPFNEPSEACIGCGSCVFICPTNIIAYTEKDGVRTVWGRNFELPALHASAATTSPPRPNWNTGPNSPATRWRASLSAGIADRLREQLV